jgi:DNA-binding MarR family transcriptional regulator
VIASWQRITHRLLSAIDHELAGLDLSAAETNVLAYMLDVECPTVRELSGATAQPPSTLTGVLDRLERRGVIARRPNPSDRRSTLIVLTPAGRETARRVGDAFDRVAARIPERTAVQFLRILAEVEGALDAMAVDRRS